MKKYTDTVLQLQNIIDILKQQTVDSRTIDVTLLMLFHWCDILYAILMFPDIVLAPLIIYKNLLWNTLFWRTYSH